jgi:hypothetical protein
MVPGTKEEPYALGEDYFCHEDNVTVEVGIPVLQDGSSLGYVVEEAKRRVQEEFFASGKKYELFSVGQSMFQPDQLLHKQAKTFGCEPDFNAYEAGRERTVPLALKRSNVRFAGGHIHLGGDFNCPPFVAALFADLFLTLAVQEQWPRLINSVKSDQFDFRNSFYGRPGIFRPKPYGIEYRTPSNWWTNSAKYGNFIGSRAMRLIAFLENTSATTLREMLKRIDWLKVQNLIAPDTTFQTTQVQELVGELNNEIRTAGVDI